MKEDPGSAASLPQLPRGRALAPALIAPGRLDGLDCILLQYPVHWPLAAVMEEDCLVGYAAVFNAMLRVRRVQLVLRRLHAAVHARSRSRPRQAPRTAHGDALYKDLGGKAVEAAEALVGAPPGEVERRLQQLRAFTHAALHLVSAIQRFQGVCTTGHGWDSLARKVAPDGPHNSRPANAQEIIDLHRAYVRRAAGDVLTFCGDAAVLEAAEAALGAALDVAGKVQAAVESSGASHVAHSAWVRELAASGTWRLILGGMETFGGAWGRMKEALGQASRGAAPLNHLSVLLDS